MGAREVASAAWALGVLLGRQQAARGGQSPPPRRTPRVPNHLLLSALPPEPEADINSISSAHQSAEGILSGAGDAAGAAPPPPAPTAALPPIVAVVFSRALTLLPDMEPQGLANVAWAAAGLGLLSPRGGAAPAAEPGKSLIFPADGAAAAEVREGEGAGTVRRGADGSGGAGLMAGLLAVSQRRLHKFTEQGLATVLHALAQCQQQQHRQGSVSGDGGGGGSVCSGEATTVGGGGTASERQARAFTAQWMKVAGSRLQEFSPQVRADTHMSCVCVCVCVVGGGAPGFMLCPEIGGRGGVIVPHASFMQNASAPPPCLCSSAMPPLRHAPFMMMQGLKAMAAWSLTVISGSAPDD